MNQQQLIDLAAERGLKLAAAQANRLLTNHPQRAEHLVTSAASLIDLASAIGKSLDVNHAIQRLVACSAAGATDDQIYEIAADRMLEPVRRKKGYVFRTEYERLERAFFGDEAKARHAVFIGHLMDGSLGYQASMLLLAAEDAGLQKAEAWRTQLVRFTGDAIERRYPIHQEPDVRVLDAEAPQSTHVSLLSAARHDERQARELVLGKLPEFATRIDRIRDRRLARDVRRVLNEIRAQLAERRDEGWMANPKAYHDKVIEPAAAAARAA